MSEEKIYDKMAYDVLNKHMQIETNKSEQVLFLNLIFVFRNNRWKKLFCYKLQ